MLFKISVLKNFANFTGKHLCWSLWQDIITWFYSCNLVGSLCCSWWFLACFLIILVISYVHLSYENKENICQLFSCHVGSNMEIEWGVEPKDSSFLDLLLRFSDCFGRMWNSGDVVLHKVGSSCQKFPCLNFDTILHWPF